MSDPKITYELDRFGMGDESDHIIIDREALHEQEVSPAVATVILLQQINWRLRDISMILHDISQR